MTGVKGRSGRHKSPESMNERLMIRVHSDIYTKLAEAMPGAMPGTVSPDEIRVLMGNIATFSAEVKAGTLSPEAAAGKFYAYFSGFFSNLASGQAEDKPG